MLRISIVMNSLAVDSCSLSHDVVSFVVNPDVFFAYYLSSSSEKNYQSARVMHVESDYIVRQTTLLHYFFSLGSVFDRFLQFPEKFPSFVFRKLTCQLLKRGNLSKKTRPQLSWQAQQWSVQGQFYSSGSSLTDVVGECHFLMCMCRGRLAGGRAVNTKTTTPTKRSFCAWCEGKNWRESWDFQKHISLKLSVTFG